ncbi:hypothetical protein, partial [Pseudomonas sp. SMV7]|uniref:hypothetical protein n=1 Tax=Pseudomonas sp. SMV7 TaxID=3390194 RepID=UPI003F85F086
DSIGVMYVVLPGGNPPEKRSGTVEYDVQVAPSIVSVQDSLGEVANNGFTFDSRVTVFGKARIGQWVELFDGTTSKVVAPVDGGGYWRAVVSGLAVGQHLVKAVALYGSKPESGGHGFEVRSGAPVISRVVDS